MVVARGVGGGRGLTAERRTGTFGVMEMSSISVVVVVTQVGTFVRAPQIL